MSTTATVWFALVAALAVAACVASAVLALLLTRERRAHRELLEQLEMRPPAGVRHGAQRALRIAFDTASRLRRDGVGSLLMSSLEDLGRWAAEDRVELVRVAEPDGSVTFVFTDIVGSTALNEAVGDKAWDKALRAHDELVRGCVGSHGGHVVKSQGDGFMLAFGDPAEAIAAAVDLQRRLARRRGRRQPAIAVRVGVHRGTAVARDGDYFGAAVATAARIAARADGGEILVSEPTLDALPVTARPATGPARRATLKGLDGERVLHPVEWRRQDIPSSS